MGVWIGRESWESAVLVMTDAIIAGRPFLVVTHLA
jgi:hypothetical protein